MEDETKKTKRLNSLLQRSTLDIVKAIERDPLNAAMRLQAEGIITMEIYKAVSAGLAAGRSALSFASQIQIGVVNSLELSPKLWPQFIRIMRSLHEDVGKKLNAGYLEIVGLVGISREAANGAAAAEMQTTMSPLDTQPTAIFSEVSIRRDSLESRTNYDVQMTRSSLATAEPVLSGNSLSEGNFCEEVGTRIPAKWRLLGISLHISTELLDGFEKKNGVNLRRCFNDVFKAWKRCNSPLAPFSWSAVVQALRRNFVGENTLAMELMQTHSIPEESPKPLMLCDPPTLLHFMEHVAFHIQAKWYDFGIMLNVQSEALDRYEQRYRGDQLACLERVFEDWSKVPSAKPFCWSSIVMALQSNLLGENNLAHELLTKLQP